MNSSGEKKRIVVIGAGGQGRVMADAIVAAGDEVVGFLDDADGENVIGKISDYEKFSDCYFIVAIGDSKTREKIVKDLNVKWATVIHPTAVISPSAIIKEGTMISANAVINTGAEIGAHNIINTGAIVEHDNVIGNFSHISVGAKLGGTVKVGCHSWLGIGCVVNNNVSICDDVMVGAGAVVIEDITESGTYVGVPAHKIIK